VKRIFPNGTPKSAIVNSVAVLVRQLDESRAWVVTVEEFRRPRTNQQNAFLWGVVYPCVIEAGNLEGWTPNDLHEYFLGECFGWETLEGMGRKKVKPVKRSSRLNKQEFSDYLEFISVKCADMGIVIPEPNEPTE
jgi:hypothetical protein